MTSWAKPPGVACRASVPYKQAHGTRGVSICRPGIGAGWRHVDWCTRSGSSFREPSAGSCMSVTFPRGETRTHQELCLFLPLPLPQVVFALNQTLLQQESLRAGSFQIPYTTEDLIKHYNCGDLSSIIFNHDTSQVSLATAALILRTCPHSANPCLAHAHVSSGRPFAGKGQRHGAGFPRPVPVCTTSPLSCCMQAAKAHLAFRFGRVLCLL